MTARVTVVLPTHNREDFVERAVHSVLAQTYESLELIVVDDCSTDSTRERLGAIHDPRFVSLRLERRCGAAAARNAGINAGSGELVAFQDSDDEWLPGKLEAQVALLDSRSDHLGGVGGRYLLGSAEPAEFAAPHLESASDYEDELLDGRCCITPVWLIRRRILTEIGGFDESMPCLEDWDLVLRISQRTRLVAVPEVVLVKYGVADSLGADIEPRAFGLRSILERHGERFRNSPRRYGFLCLELAYLCALAGKHLLSVRYMTRALRSGAVQPATALKVGAAAARGRLGGQLVWPLPSLTDRA